MFIHQNQRNPRLFFLFRCVLTYPLPRGGKLHTFTHRVCKGLVLVKSGAFIQYARFKDVSRQIGWRINGETVRVAMWGWDARETGWKISAFLRREWVTREDFQTLQILNFRTYLKRTRHTGVKLLFSYSPCYCSRWFLFWLIFVTCQDNFDEHIVSKLDYYLWKNFDFLLILPVK